MAEDPARPSTAVLPPDEDSHGKPADRDSDLRRLVRSEIRKALPKAIEEATRRLDHDEEIAGLVHLLAARSNDAKDEVLRKALTLYGFALDAREKGNRLAVISPDDYIVHDVIGFESMIEALGSRKD